MTTTDLRRQEPAPAPAPRTKSEQSAVSPWRRAWIAAGLVFAASRLAYLAVTLLHLRAGHRPNAGLHDQVVAWLRFDSYHFLRIAESGYTFDHTEDAAFFPLYPLLIRAVSVLTGGHLLIAGLLVSNVACLGALVVLHRLAAIEIGNAAAERVIYYVVAFPTAYFLGAAYNHSLFLLLVVGCLLAMRREHWWLAGGIGALASATRSAGVVLLIPFAFEYLRQRGFAVRRLRADALAVLLVPAGLVAYCLYTWRVLGDPMAFSTAQDHWLRSLDWPGHTLYMGVQTMFVHPFLDSYEIILDVVLTVTFLVLLVLSVVGPWKLRRDQFYLFLYGLPAVLLPLFFPRIDNNPMLSMSRLLIDVMPVFLVLGRMGASRWFDRLLPIPLVALQCTLLVMFLNNEWAF
jgi:Gpi18-like mannosyltransferase